MPHSLNSPESKKVVLIDLIDQMTAAAIDKSAQSHIQFLNLRVQLIATLENYTEIDRNRIRVVKSVIRQLNDALPGMFDTHKELAHMPKRPVSNSQETKVKQDIFHIDKDLIHLYIDSML